MRDKITIQGAKEHNLKNISIDIPRDQLVVITGVSGSGKSTLAFDTIYAEGQRRYLESMSTFTKKFTSQMKKPNVDFLVGLSPVISIEQKTTVRNPRSTVGTMTDIYDYLRMLFATIGIAHCPYCQQEVPVKNTKQLLDQILSLPQGAQVEIRAPVYKYFGEDYAYLLDDIRVKGYRKVYIDNRLVDTAQPVALDEDEAYHIDVLIDLFTIQPTIDKQVSASLEHGLLIGEGFISLHVLDQIDNNAEPSTHAIIGCHRHGVVMGEVEAHYFSFNLPSATSSCVTCLGLGTYRRVHPDLLVLNKNAGICNGAFSKEALNYDKNNWTGRIIYSLAQHYGFNLDTPIRELPAHILDILFYGTRGDKFKILLPEGATIGERHVGKEMRFGGIINHIERSSFTADITSKRPGQSTRHRS